MQSKNTQMHEALSEIAFKVCFLGRVHFRCKTCTCRPGQSFGTVSGFAHKEVIGPKKQFKLN